MEIDADAGTVRMDWHHYSLDQVDTWADRIVEAAWAHGFEWVEFVHGAPDIGTRGTIGWSSGHAGGGGAAAEGRRAPRGTIKELLRKRLFGNRWHRWARERREGMHRLEEGSMTIALRKNPRPTKGAKWPLVPPPAHG